MKLLFWGLLYFAGAVVADLPCVPRSYAPDRIVCVCNATYCDTLNEPTPLPRGQYVQYTTNIAGLRFEQTTGSFQDVSREEGVHMTINVSSKYQTILGFGAAFTDAAGLNLNSLSSGAQEKLMSSYFGPEGIELTFGRVPIGGCDFSTRPYSYGDDVENDTILANFSLTTEDHLYKIPVIKRALESSTRGLKLIGAAWSPPVWMKTNNAWFGNGFLLEEYYEAWAEYHIKFLDEYKKEGLDFWCISTGNEPFNGVVPIAQFNSMGWLPEDQLRWVREHLGPSLKRSQHGDTMIIALDDQRFTLPVWTDHMRNNTEAMEYISGLGVHWYADKFTPASVLEVAHETLPSKFLLATEACSGSVPWDRGTTLGSWSHAEDYMADIIEDLSYWVAGWVDWNFALDPTGGPNWAKNFVDAPIIVNATSDEFYKQPSYYALGHFAKFVPEGSVRVSIEPKIQGRVYSIAFLTPDGATVVVLYNRNANDAEVTISDPDKGNVNLLLSGESFQTIIYW